MDISTLKNIILFEDLPDSALEAISKLFKTNHYQKDNIILFEEDLGDLLFFIIEGEVKITRANEMGREIILSIIQKGDFFGEMSILDGESRSANAVTLSDATIIIINRDDFYFILKKYPDVAIRLLKNLTQRLRRADKLIESLSLNDAEHRICNTLFLIAEDAGIYKNKGVVISKLPNQDTLASMSGTSRETVSRMFSKLKSKNLIQVEKHELVILNYDNFITEFIDK
ncbi:MAG: Crp/Fnr family transcriptional regulator [Candidatus Marinimicrobia bacterium]|nr:Crp/Fnr family transcriptional regulator [Candidatus Neomarinimicrobiota bacterium]